MGSMGLEVQCDGRAAEPQGVANILFGSALEGRVLDSGLGLKLREGVYLRSELNGGFRKGGEVKGKREREREWGLGEGQGLSGSGLSLP